MMVNLVWVVMFSGETFYFSGDVNKQNNMWSTDNPHLIHRVVLILNKVFISCLLTCHFHTLFTKYWILFVWGTQTPGKFILKDSHKSIGYFSVNLSVDITKGCNITSSYHCCSLSANSAVTVRSGQAVPRHSCIYPHCVINQYFLFLPGKPHIQTEPCHSVRCIHGPIF
jgi:hypothetical protein